MNESAQAIVDLIERNKSNPLVLVTPLGSLLPAIRQWIISTEARLAALEKHEA